MRSRQILGGLCLSLLCVQAGLCKPYEWSEPVPTPVIAPSDRTEGKVRGASLQGSLVDLRWGQVSVNVGGTAHILDWTASSEFTLNGSKIKPESLAKMVKQGQSLMVAVRYNDQTGAIGWLDALTQDTQAAVRLDISPYRGPAMKTGQILRVRIPANEWRRLGLSADTSLFAPGMAHQMKFEDKLAELPLMKGWEWDDIPLYVKSSDGKVYRGKSLSVSGSGPQIAGFGPEIASQHLSRIPCWVDLRGASGLISLQDCRVTSTLGSRVEQRTLRDGRLSFFLEVDGPGTYELQVVITDQLDRETNVNWILDVRP